MQTHLTITRFAHTHDFSNSLRGRMIFSKIDRVRACYRILAAPGDIPKSAVLGPFCLYEFFRTPFDLRNPAQTLQRLMDQVRCGLAFSFVYTDVVLIDRTDEHEHREHLRLVFQCFQEYWILTNTSKCILCVLCIKFLGTYFDGKGSKPLESRVSTIGDQTEPQSFKILRHSHKLPFPSHFQLFRGLATTHRTSKNGSCKFLMTPEAKRSLLAAKEALSPSFRT